MLDFSTMLVAGIPLMLVVFALVEMVKTLGLKGRGCTIASMLIGLLLGACYQVAEAGVPRTFAAAFAVIVFGLTLGLAASGFYKWGSARFPQVKDQ